MPQAIQPPQFLPPLNRTNALKAKGNSKLFQALKNLSSEV